MSDVARLTVVIPTRNSAPHIAKTIAAVETLGAIWRLTIVVVDDASDDGTLQTLTGLTQDAMKASSVIVAMARNVGQSAATAIGLSHADGDFVLTLDDDLTFPVEEVPNLLTALTEDLDFVVGAPSSYSRSLVRRMASRAVRWIGVRTLKTPRDFVFSSFVLYRGDFLSRIDIRSQLVDEIGWMFPFTTRYRNVSVRTAEGLRSRSNYRVRDLISTAKPLGLLLQRITLSVTRAVTMASVALSVALAIRYLLATLLDKNLQPGFPTLVILALLNLAVSSWILGTSVVVRRELAASRHSTVFNCQRRVIRIIR